MIIVLLLVILNGLINRFPALISVYNLSYWQNQFSKSQLVIGDKAPYFFSDEDIYSIVGIKYLLGDLPTNLHPEVPPLGKILVGSSIFIFKNISIISLLFAICSLLLVYLLGRYSNLPKNWSILALIIISLDKQFWYLSTSAMLDIFLLVFLLLAFLSAYRGLKNPSWFLLSSLFLGFMASTKLYFTSLVAVAVCTLAILSTGSFKKFIQFIFSLIFYPVGFMLPYINSFLEGISLLDFLRFQRWLTHWWAGNSKVPFGGIFPMIFLNQWHTWWGKKAILPVPDWNIFWPISAGLAYLSPIFMKSNKLVLLTVFWIIGYLGFLTITSPFPRYILLLFPFWVVLALKSIHEAFTRFSHFQGRS